MVTPSKPVTLAFFKRGVRSSRNFYSSGKPLADIYKNHGLNMLPNRATFEDGSSGVEAGVAMMLDRMHTGRFKVFEHLTEWFEEFRMYHRKDGRIQKQRDDIMAATRYAVMELRKARTKSEIDGFWRPLIYPDNWSAGIV